MSFADIFSDAIRYPFTDIIIFLIIGVLALLASLPSVLTAFGVDNAIISLIFQVIALVFMLFLSGYGISVIRRALMHSNQFPLIDPATNLMDGVKAFIVRIVYFIIPAIITAVLALFSGVAGYEFHHVFAALGFAGIIAMVIFIAFAIFEVVAMARFAKTGNLASAFNIGQVIGDVNKIGFLNILLFLIASLIVMFIAGLVSTALSYIPYVGVIIATILIGAFAVLFFNRALGLLYSHA